jgi:hypothetical protein
MAFLKNQGLLALSMSVASIPKPTAGFWTNILSLHFAIRSLRFPAEFSIHPLLHPSFQQHNKRFWFIASNIKSK